MTTTRTFVVHGMTCEHCTMSVREEVLDAAGVTDAHVDRISGRLDVTGADFTDDAIRSAVTDAGYGVVA